MQQMGLNMIGRRMAGRVGAGVALLIMLWAPLSRAAANQTSLRWNITTAKVAVGQHEFVRLSKVQIRQWSCPGDIVVREKGHGIRRIPTADILAVQLRKAVLVPVVSAWQLVLRDRDVLPGYPVGTRHENIIFHASGLGVVHIPLSAVAGLRRSEKVAIPDSAADHDSLYFNNNSHLAGAVVKIGRKHIVFQSNLGNTTIPLSRVNHVILGGVATLPTGPEPGARIVFLNGASLRTPKFDWSDGKLSLVDPAGKTISVPIREVARIEIVGGRAVWLTDLKPTRIHQVSWIGDNRPIRNNRCVTGRPLRMNGEEFTHGLGVHVNCSVTYKLGGLYQYFMVRPAMDDSAGAYGRANVVILADGK